MFAALRRAGASLAAQGAPPALLAPLRPVFGSLGTSIGVRWLKVRSSIKKRCEDCYIVRRGKINFVYCKTNGRHKARQGPKRKQG